MNRNSNWYHRRQGAIDRRRLEVARLLLKGFSQREITAELEAMGCVNPDSQKPYSLMAINVDCKRLTQEWRERAAADVDDILGQQLAEIREARRAAWKDGDLNAVYRGMELEIKLLGTSAPEKREVSGPGGMDLVIKLSWDDPRITDED